MTTARQVLRVAALCLVPGLLGLGCGGDPPAGPNAKATKKVGPTRQEPLEAAITQLRQSDDPASCREALHQVERHLDADAEGRRQVRADSAALRQLQDRLGLDTDELEEISGAAFQPLDAQHASVCLQLRDVVESLDLQGKPPLRQATEAFAWVVRQVTLRSGLDDIILPPEVALQVGEGTAHERALLFLGLLHQLDIDGCMIALPGDGPGRERYWVPGARIAGGGKAAIYLFDTRLGMPVPGPGGKGVATLRQVRADPGLLARLGADKDHPYDVTATEAVKAEVRLVLPLSALAPRMKYLEKLLDQRDRVRLALDPAGLRRRFEEATGAKVGVWNRRSQPGLPRPWTPTRAARLFLPAEDGGLDRAHQGVFQQGQEMLSSAVLRRNYRQILAYDDLPREARERLRDLAERLSWKYVVYAQQRLTHGRLDDAMRRLSRINAVVQDFRRSAPPAADMRKEVAQWRARVRTVYLALARHETGAQKKAEDLWSDDQYILALVEPSDEEDELPSVSRRVSSFLVLGAAAGPLDDDAVYRLALCWQEKAVRLRAEQGPGPSADPGRDEMQQGAWDNARDLAREYASRYPLRPADVHNRVQAVLAEWRAPEQHLDTALGLWDYLFRTFRRTATIRLLQARALRAAGQEKEARQVLGKLAAELAALRQDRELRDALDECTRRAAQFPPMPQPLVRLRLERLTRALAAGGSLAWLEQAARLQQR